MESKDTIYYFRDKRGINNENGRPLITVAITEYYGKYYRGIAICSKRDIPCKATGRNIAIQRMIHAIGSKHSSLEMNRDEAFEIFELIEYPDMISNDGSFSIGVYKSNADAKLTEFEEKLLHGEKTNG